MLRTTAIGLASIIALGLSLASPAAGAMGSHSSGGGGGGGGSSMRGPGGGGGPGGNMGHAGMMSARSESSAGRYADHDIGHDMGHDLGHMRMDHDRDHGRDHDRDHFRFFPSFAFGINTYANDYDPGYGDCWELHRVLIHGHWRLRRIWVCD